MCVRLAGVAAVERVSFHNIEMNKIHADAHYGCVSHTTPGTRHVHIIVQKIHPLHINNKILVRIHSLYISIQVQTCIVYMYGRITASISSCSVYYRLT